MKSLSLVVFGLLSALSPAVSASSSFSSDPILALEARALPNGPSGNYTPLAVVCPANRPSARTASSLSPNETAWLKLRRNKTLQPLIDFLTAANIAGFNATSYVEGASSDNVPTIGLAISGGGYRALMNGAGFLAAADSRTPNQTQNGSISGLLQASTYLAGLSGGGWLVGSIFANNFSSVVQLRDGYEDSDLWRFDNSIFAGPSSDAQDNGASTVSGSGSSTKRRSVEAEADAEDLERRGIISTADYWNDVVDQVAAKADAGYNTSITDYWGRALSYQLINAPLGGIDYTFSSIALADNFALGDTPFPILVADSRVAGTSTIALNSTVFEFNAFEMGTWDPTIYGFVPTEFLGSNFSNGIVPRDGDCVRGFDQFGYVMGTSSTLFNQFLLYNLTEVAPDVPEVVIDVIEKVLGELGADSNDIAQYEPNPFLGYRPATNPFADSSQLILIDGGEDLQNIPLQPLIQPVRAVDIIVAVDSSADTNYSWPNGTALRATYERGQTPSGIANGTLFPAVPDADTFVNLGLNQRPTFFGCDASNFSSGSHVPPLVVYLPNAPFTAWSNVSTFTPSYSLAQRNSIIQNGFNMATRVNGTFDADWPACLACAVLSRSFTRSNTTVPSACTACFTKYCWDGTLNTTSEGVYEPKLLVEGAASASENAAPALFFSSAPKAIAVALSTLFVLVAL